MVAVKASITSSRCSGCGMIVATTTTDTDSSLAGEDGAQGGRDIGVGADAPQPPVAEAGELAGQVRVLLAGGVEQHVQPRQPGGERPGIGASVVHAIREQNGPGIPRRDPSQLAGGDL